LITFYFRFNGLPNQALENAAPGSVVANKFDGTLPQVWSRLSPTGLPQVGQQPEAGTQDGGLASLPEGQPADQLNQTKPPEIDMPEKLENLRSTNEFRGCQFQPVIRSYECLNF